MKPAKTWDEKLAIGLVVVLVIAGLLVVAYVAAIFFLMSNFGSNK
jgi:uncharacterized protein (UPF0333 family)